MSPRKLRRKYDSQCYRRLRHEHFLTALHHAARLRSLHPNDSISIYPCNFCAGFHVGHKDKTLPEQDLILLSSVEALYSGERILRCEQQT